MLSRKSTGKKIKSLKLYLGMGRGNRKLFREKTPGYRHKVSQACRSLSEPCLTVFLYGYLACLFLADVIAAHTGCIKTNKGIFVLWLKSG